MKAFAARILPMAATLCLMGFAVPPASAAEADVTTGGCGFDTNSVPLQGGPTTYTGVMYDVSATHNGAGLPTGATVSCKILVNGVDAPGTLFDYPGYGAQAGADPMSFEAGPADIVLLCQRTVYADGTDSGWYCPSALPLPFPPQWVIDDINLAFGVVDGVEVWDVDPRVCPVLAAHPGTYGDVTINADGDVYVADPFGLGLNPVYDCPPYGNY
jgi:hypothetical protein